MTPLDFSIFTGLKIANKIIVTNFNLVGDKMRVVGRLDQYPLKVVSGVVAYIWFREAFYKRQNQFSYTQLTRSFLMYMLGYSLFCTRADCIHLSI